MANDRFKMVGYTGAELRVPWWGKIAFDIDGIRTGEKMPALREHKRDRAVGVIDKTARGRDGLTAQGFFLQSTRDGREVKALIEEGFPFQASIGVDFDSVEEVQEGKTASVNGSKFTGPGIIIRQSHVREISFVSLGADDKTSVGIAASRGGATVTPITAAPANFDEAVIEMLHRGHGPRESIEAAAKEWPHLWKQYQKMLRVEE